MYVCDDVVFAKSEEFGLVAVEDITIGHTGQELGSWPVSR